MHFDSTVKGCYACLKNRHCLGGMGAGSPSWIALLDDNC